MARRSSRKQYGDVATHLRERLRSPRFRRAWAQTEADMALAKQLIRLRSEQGLTQEQVAEMVNTSQSALSRLERHPPRKETPLLKRLAKLYDHELRVRVSLIPRT